MLTPMSERSAAERKPATEPDGATTDPALLDLPAALEEFVTTNRSPSGIVAVARHGQILESHAWGADGYDLDTPFRIASCTKSFTALALLILRREGRIGLDDPVVQHLPELKIEAPVEWPTLRIRHLLSMSAGLATDNPWGDRQESVSREQLSAWLSGGLRLIFAPGSAFEYSNLGYAFLGEVITRLSGQDYREFVRERIIDPLGLRGTRFAATELEAVAAGYHREPALPGQPSGWTPQEPSGPGGFSPIGGLYSNVADLVAWAQLYLGRDVPAGVGFTAADLLEAQQPLTHVFTGPADAPLRGLYTAGYGYGLIVEKYTDHGTVVSHSGGYPGFTTYMCWHVESGYTVISSANGTHSGVGQPTEKVLLPLIAAAKASSARGEGASRSSASNASSSAVGPEGKTWPETEAAVGKIGALIREAATGTPGEVAARHAELFAENVELDFPLARRVEYLQQALTNLGQLRSSGESRKPTFERPSSARWWMPAQFGRLELYIELAPVAPFGVQTFAAAMVNGWQKVKLF